MVLDFTVIEAAIIAAIPTITAVGAIITAVVKFIKSLNQLKDNEELKAERDALAEQNKALLSEVKRQNKLTKLFIEKASRVAFKDMSEVKNDKELQD